MTPTQRSLAHLRSLGYLAEVVERFNWHTKRRHDLWGCVDILAIRSGEVVGVQTTSGSNVAARIDKIRELGILEALQSAGIRICVHGWAKRKPRGTKRALWTLREVWLTTEAGNALANP